MNLWQIISLTHRLASHFCVNKWLVCEAVASWSFFYSASVLASYLWSCLVRLLSLWQDTWAKLFQGRKTQAQGFRHFIAWQGENGGAMWSTSWRPGSREKHAFLPAFLSSLLDDVTHKTNKTKQIKTISHLFSLLTFSGNVCTDI